MGCGTTWSRGWAVTSELGPEGSVGDTEAKCRKQRTSMGKGPGVGRERLGV